MSRVVLAVLALVLSCTLGTAERVVAAKLTADPILDKERSSSVVSKAIRTAGNDIYEIFIEDDSADSECGTWTAVTGASHPAGSGLDVLFGNGQPRTSNTILRSYTSGTDYSTGSACTSLCAEVPPVATPILNGATTVGYRFL